MLSPESRPPQESPQDQLRQELKARAKGHSQLDEQFQNVAIDAAATVLQIPDNDTNALWALAWDLDDRALQTKQGTKVFANLKYTWNMERDTELTPVASKQKLAEFMVKVTLAESLSETATGEHPATNATAELTKKLINPKSILAISPNKR